MKIIRRKDLAKLLSVSCVTIWRMEKRGELPPKVRISRRACGWLESDIREWIKDRRIDETKTHNNTKTVNEYDG